MEEKNTGENTQELEQTNQEVAPASEDQTQESGQTQDQDQNPENVDSQQNITNEVDDESPKDNAAWAAMRVENKRLKEALTETGVDPDYLDQINQANSTFETPYVGPQVTPDTDMDTVLSAVNQSHQAAQKAISEANRIRREMEDREAEREFPELRSDPVFQQMVAEKRLVSEVMGRKRPTLAIAREVAAVLRRREEQVGAQAQQQAKQQFAERQVAQAQPATTTSSGRSSVNDESLRQRIRKGDQGALAQRLKETQLSELDF